MEGRGYTDLNRNTSEAEEWFMKSMMESSMEMLGVNNNNNNFLSQSFRADSEELFNNWLTNSENNGGGLAHRTRQASTRISAETSNVSNQQHGGLHKKRTEEILFQQNVSMAGASSLEPNQSVTMNFADMSLQASNLFLAKAWFNSSQPMTRSRSSELRRRYVQQNSYTSIGMEAMNNMNSVDANNFKQQDTNPNGFINAQITEFPNQLTSFMSPSNSSSCTFNTPQATGNNADNNISSVVNMLKGTLERKNVYNNDIVEREALEESPFGYYGSEEMLSAATGLNHQVQENFTYNTQQQGNYGVYGVAATTNHFQRSTLSREPSQSESSLVVSAGFENCDGSSVSGQTPCVSESTRKQTVNGKSSGNDPRTRVEQGDSTKKRRVERSRKMAEAKEKNMTPPAVNTDMQSLLKRCENLEKEVRSLKLNLAFMNRKDSEQTKQTEELEKQNEKLSMEKGRLLEEIERIISQTHKM